MKGKKPRKVFHFPVIIYCSHNHKTRSATKDVNFTNFDLDFTWIFCYLVTQEAINGNSYARVLLAGIMGSFLRNDRE
jgi:hypothetical protein